MTLEWQMELKDLVAGFSIMSSNSYVLQGRSYNIMLDEKNTDSNILMKRLISHLGNTLYQIYHCRQDSDYYYNYENQMMTLSRRYHDNRDFVELLSKANASQGTWEPGWEIRKFEKNGQIAVQKDGLTLWILPQQFIPSEKEEKEGKRIEVGKKGHIAMVREFRSLLPGFYMANGNAPLNQSPPLVRIYWNISATGATFLLKHITAELNNEKVPFQFKILNNPTSFVRADAGVLYMNKQFLEKSRKALATIHRQVKPFLRPKTPLFAKRLTHGVSLAEDPNNGESFGQHRTRIFAEALYDMNEKNRSSSEDEKLAEVSRHFKSLGIDMINKPYMNAGSVDDNNDNYDVLFEGVFDQE
jgi:hypothetical protein